MTRKNLIPFFLYTFFLLTSCSSTKKTMDSWIGSSKQQLIMSWGPPTRTADDGAGGEILVYSRQGHIPPSTFYANNGSSTTTQGQTYWDYKMFWINTQGKVYHWMTQREQIPPTQIDLNIYKRN